MSVRDTREQPVVENGAARIPAWTAQDPKPVHIPRAGAFCQDVRHGTRLLFKNPGFTIVAALTLALGIGANTAIFSVVNAALLTPIPVPTPEDVVMVWSDRVAHGIQGFPASAPDFLDWRASGIFEKLAGFTTDGFNLLIGNTPARVQGASVTKEWFEILQAKPYLGRVFQDGDMHPGDNRVVILTYDLWHRRFGSDPGIVGRTTIINNSPYTVVGVLPKRSAKLADEELYVPLLLEPPLATQRGIRYIGTVGRLAPGVGFTLAQKRMSDITERLEKEYPNDDAGVRARLQPIEEAYTEDVHTLLLVLFGAVVFVLLIACANIANLLLVRGTARQKEMAIRAALGASKLQLLRQLLIESVLLSLLGGLAAIAPALAGIRLLTKFKLETLPNSELVSLNPTVLAFTFVLAIGAGVLFGIIPASETWRASAESSLRERSQASGDLRFGNLFVIGETALAVMLVAGAGLMLRSFLQMRAAYPGYDAKHVLTMRVSLTGKQYDDPIRQVAFVNEAVHRLGELPGVRSAGAIDSLPTSSDVRGGTIHFTDRPEPKQSEAAIVVVGSVTPGYFQTMRIPLVRGRLFSDADGERDPLVVIIDDGISNEYWPRQDPVGKMIRLRMHAPLRKIVGVVGNIDRTVAVKLKGRLGQVYVPFAQSPNNEMSFAASTLFDAHALIPAARRVLGQLAPDQPVYHVQTMEEARAAGQASPRFATWLLGFFAGLSLLLAAIGVYGVISYSVGQRTREIGVRMALGATPQQLLLAVLGRAVLLMAAGLALGLAGAMVLARFMESMLHGISPTDPLTLISVVGLLMAVGVLATLLPAIRASRVEPMVALRYE